MNAVEHRSACIQMGYGVLVFLLVHLTSWTGVVADLLCVFAFCQVQSRATKKRKLSTGDQKDGGATAPAEIKNKGGKESKKKGAPAATDAQAPESTAKQASKKRKQEPLGPDEGSGQPELAVPTKKSKRAKK